MNWLWLLKSLESEISLGFWTKVLTRKRCLVNPFVVSWQNTIPMLKVKWVFIWQCLALTYRMDGQVFFSYQSVLLKDTKAKDKHCRIKTFLLKVESNQAECWKPVPKWLQDSFGIKCGLFSAKELHWPTLSMTISYFLSRCLKRRLEIVLWNYIRLIKDFWRYARNTFPNHIFLKYYLI